MIAAIDLGITNIDIVVRREAGLEYFCMSNSRQPILEQVWAVFKVIGSSGAGSIEQAAVTGGQYRSLPERVGDTRLVKVSEVESIGRGGLRLAKLEQALVVSAGSGTAMVAARGRSMAHVTGSAVGGGTLQGLGRLLLGTPDPLEIDRLAQQGNANHADLTLIEAVGAGIGRLPVNANAVNFGRLSYASVELSPADRAAALVRLVGQVIAVVAINASRAEGLEKIVVIGHLVDLPSVCQVLDEVAGFYNANIIVPPQPGTGTVLGALLCMEEGRIVD